jgi:hypothetical protein
MLLKSLEFAAITFGVTMVVALFVAAMIKAIALVIQRGAKNASGDKSK